MMWTDAVCGLSWLFWRGDARYIRIYEPSLRISRLILPSPLVVAGLALSNYAPLFQTIFPLRTSTFEAFTGGEVSIVVGVC